MRIGSSCVKGLFKSDVTPSSPGKRVYEAHEHMSITLGPPVGSGAVGTVHKAWIELCTRDSKVLRHSCVVKLALDEEAQKALRNEFNAYQHLATKGMFEAIVRVHGLFRDADTGTCALVMDHGGRSLWNIEHAKNKDYQYDYVVVDKEQQLVIIIIFS